MATDPMRQILAGFVNEAHDLCQRVTLELLSLERKEPGSAEMAEGYRQLGRALHTLKGSAATLGLDALAGLAHQLEEKVGGPKRALVRIPSQLGDELLVGLDQFLNSLSAQVAGSVPSTPAPPLGDSGPEEAPVIPEERSQWRVEAQQVVALIREVERLREIRLRLEERKRDVERTLTALTKVEAGLATDEVRDMLLSQVRALGSDAEETADLVRTLEEVVKSISAIPVRTLLDPLHRAVRDLCRATRKQARLSVVGAEISLDRRVLESIRGPLVHLIRNAVDHGIESPGERILRGKHREGALTVRVEQQGNMLFLEVADDGDGVDLDRVKEVALERGLYGKEELALMSDAQVTRLIFHSGLSTRSHITELSGRGVGLDAVQAEVKAMHGNVEVESVRGQGTRFVVTVPIELGSSPMLMVRCAEQDFALPLLSVQATLRARRSEVRKSSADMRLEHSGELLPLLELGALLRLRESELPRDGQPLLVVQSKGQRIVLAVDAMSGDRELVVRPMPPEVRDVPAYQGACTLARGELVGILRPDWLVSADRRSLHLKGRVRRALVVDDSLTARALHRTMLESGGYTVHAVASGVSALEHLRQSPYDVVVCDIGMEEMDGFALTEAVRSRGELGRLPIILVSAHDSDTDRAKGLAVGADGFLSKRECATGRLLSEISDVISRRAGMA